MYLNWTGPFQVTEVVSLNVYRVESLTGKVTWHTPLGYGFIQIVNQQIISSSVDSFNKTLKL
eukprot:snap_masked-scaffold_65-processed-gene-0.2-mRNA-1 protein AED:1.00 eAED:1.00 QI:0/-1/0/0/-1/1/1/0/61